MPEHVTRRLRVLIVEDHVDLGDALVETVELLGHEARVARDGAAALNGWSQPAPPDVALVDLRLPEVDGYEVARRVRQEGAATLLVAITGDPDRDVPRRCAAAGFDRYLLKPVRLSELERLLRGSSPAAVALAVSAFVP